MALNIPQTDWKAWFDACGPRLMLFARQQTRCETDAEDVLQETFLRLCRERREEPPDLPLVFATIRRVAIDQARRRERRLAREEVVARETPAIFFDRGFENGDRAAFIEKALRQLPEPQQEVLILKIWGELTFEEVGETVGIPANTAASRYRYALQSLRQQLHPSNL